MDIHDLPDIATNDEFVAINRASKKLFGKGADLEKAKGKAASLTRLQRARLAETVIGRMAVVDNGDRRLIVAMILQAISDLASKYPHEQADAEKFFRSRQFRRICGFVNLDSEAVQRVLLTAKLIKRRSSSWGADDDSQEIARAGSTGELHQGNGAEGIEGSNRKRGRPRSNG